MQKKSPLALIILDGWGHREMGEHNAIFEAHTPFYDGLMEKYPHTLLNASEEHVGLPGGTIGNSEIGHMTMGSGRVIDTDLVRISKAMERGGFNSNPAFLALFNHVKKNDSTLHIMGLLSEGGVHSHQQHLHGILAAAKAAGLKDVVVHVFTDGRDVPPKSAAKSLEQLEKVMANLQIGYIATATGRYYALDRDKNWDRTEKAEKAIFEALGNSHSGKNPSEVVDELYKQGIIDELLEPLVFLDDQGKAYPIKSNDGILFFNFRSDRPRQLARKIMERAKTQNLYFVTMTEYDPTIESHVAFPPAQSQTTLAAEISQAGLKQAHIAETEKYAHVTFFFNGGRQEPYPNEEDILIESRKDVKTHDQAPQMRAKEITDAAIKRVENDDDFLVINYANADMVGHTANKAAIITAVETVDRELKRLVEAISSHNGIAIITADHGNAEVNLDEQTGEKHTAHTLNQVPFVLVSPPFQGGVPSEAGGGGWSSPISLKPSGSLADIAPTILQLMNLKKPASMTGESLLIE